MIEQHVAWNDDIGEWQLRCVAYTGNNMRKQTPQPDKDKEKVNNTGCPFHDLLGRIFDPFPSPSHLKV